MRAHEANEVTVWVPAIAFDGGAGPQKEQVIRGFALSGSPTDSGTKDSFTIRFSAIKCRRLPPAVRASQLTKSTLLALLSPSSQVYSPSLLRVDI